MYRPFNLETVDDIPAFAQHILTTRCLEIQGVRHSLAEIEIYLWSSTHPDPFSHRNPIQREPGKWYFHTQGTSGTYKGGTYKGLDITFDLDSAIECYGGILIRSINLPNGSLLEGPCKVVDYILQTTGHPTIKALVEAMASLDVTDMRNPLQLVSRDPFGWLHPQMAADPPRVYASPRVGLSLKRFSPDKLDYLMRPYRFLTSPEIKKYKNLIILAMLKEGLTAEQIHELTRTSIPVIRRYQEQFNTGTRRNRPMTAEFTGDLSVNDLNYLYGALST
jgi:hypothetical protein